MGDLNVKQIRDLMEYEASRTAPPDGFPSLPDLPGGRYTDQRFFDLEKEHIWRKSWLFAAHIDEIPEPGCFMLWENASQPVVIVHADNGDVNAFYNTCSHRGAPVVTDAKGKRNLLTCRYHGWSYSHDGELVAIRDPEDFGADFDFKCRGLTKVRCERFGNLIWVNFDPDAISLLDWLGPIADEWREFQFENCRLAQRHTWDLDCNWKIAMEANTEVYHVKSIHPNTVSPILDDRRNVNTFYPNGHGRMIAPAPGGEKLPGGMLPAPHVAEIETVGEIGRTCTQSYGIFPNWVSPLSNFYIPPLLFWPLGINKTRFETFTFAPQWGDGPAPDLWTQDGKELSQVLQEDTEFGIWIQKSVESYGFKGVPLSYQEARIYHWNQFADKMIGIDNIPEDLRVAQVIGDDWIYPNDPRVALMEKSNAVGKA